MRRAKDQTLYEQTTRQEIMMLIMIDCSQTASTTMALNLELQIYHSNTGAPTAGQSLQTPAQDQAIEHQLQTALRVGVCHVLACVCPICLCDLKQTQKQSSEKQRERLTPKFRIKAVVLLFSGSHSPHYSHVQHAQKHFSTSEVLYIHSRNAVIIFLGTRFRFSRKKTNRKRSKRSYLINPKAAVMNNAGVSKLFSACQKMASG